MDKTESRTYKTLDATIAMEFFDSSGYNFSRDLFAFYLSNPGPTSEYPIKNEYFLKVINTENVKSVISKCLDSIIEQARRDPQVGIMRELTSDWQEGGPTDDPDVKFSIGHFSVSVGSDTIVRESAEGLRAEIKYKVYIWDYYNFDTHTWVPFGNVKENIANDIGNHMRQLEEAGWARSFVTRGESSSVETRTQAL
ncbi:hypothetical protein [Nocardia sp. NPDC005366]|uniref:hypothetical protein n=1 Tax=Nocardia sp. NPDC005366 TaxID=3156878 RepID=UPI0033A410DE